MFISANVVLLIAYLFFPFYENFSFYFRNCRTVYLIVNGLTNFNCTHLKKCIEL